MDGKRFDAWTVAFEEAEPTRRSVLRRVGLGGLAALLASIGVLEVGSTDVAAGRRRKRRRRGRRGRRGGGGGGSSSSSSGGGGGSSSTTIILNNQATTPAVIINNLQQQQLLNNNNVVILDRNGDGVPDEPPPGQCPAVGASCATVACCAGLICLDADRADEIEALFLEAGVGITLLPNTCFFNVVGGNGECRREGCFAACESAGCTDAACEQICPAACGGVQGTGDSLCCSADFCDTFEWRSTSQGCFAPECPLER